MAKNKVRGPSNPAPPAAKNSTQSQSKVTATSSSAITGRSAINSQIAAMNHEHDMLTRQHQQYPAPVMNKRHSFSSSSYLQVSDSTTTASAVVATPTSAAQYNNMNSASNMGVGNYRSNARSKEIADLENELRNSEFSRSNADSLPEFSEHVQTKSGSREKLRKFSTPKSSSNLSLKNNYEFGNPTWNGVINNGTASIDVPQMITKQPSNPVSFPTTPIPPTPQRTKSTGSFFRMLFSSSSSSHPTSSSPLPDQQSSSFRLRRGRQSPQQQLQPPQQIPQQQQQQQTQMVYQNPPYQQRSSQQQQHNAQPVLNISTSRTRRVPSQSNLRPKSPAAPKTPRTPFGSFFPRLSARTPQAPTSLPSAMTYYAMRSPSTTGSIQPGSPTSSNKSANIGGKLAPPMPEIPAEFLDGTRTASIAGANVRIERRKSHSGSGFVGAGGVGGVGAGTTTQGRMKSSLKKSASSFFGAK
ncbi:hypothetical protein HK100_011464 [Physocladia obscura]|uniref:Uncharacterized protein n=1 Tax=Physocladia obscura TaxID=109957 RepID=A0AAD5XGW3_9FUNG|nr:hypothetical protein HK100_011464 [Physocladia obscura]